MKLSAYRHHLYLRKKVILRAIARHGSWCIAEYNGKGWPTWWDSHIFKTRETTENAIETICKRDPQRFINDNSLSSAGTQLNADGERAYTAIS